MTDRCCHVPARRYLRVLSSDLPLLVSVEELKEHARIDEDCDDGLLQGLILAATKWAENYTRRALGVRQYQLGMACFPQCPDSVLELPGLPVTALDNLEYTDQDGVDRSMVPGGDIVPRTVFTEHDARVLPEDFYGSWPRTDPTQATTPDENVRVTYTAGYTYQTVPAPISVAIKMLATHYYEHPEAVTSEKLAETPMGVKHLLSAYRDGRQILGSVTNASG